ncbi:Pycsar system effector family protein [Catenuloplanes japonicus]|uniref:Pycsar system effector family protein n=1 Tax=Catenuloplanes japonicus TaxID=33876 RepID=UPI000A104BD0|nr:Pycsar system effector family protein [Catenuloplanes japonicus]
MTRTMDQPREVAFTWQVHAGLEAMAARADAKAGILLAHQGGAFVLGISAWQMGGSPAVVLAMLLVVAAMGTSIAVVAPVLRPKGRMVAIGDLIYFGHLREWQAQSLAERLGELSEDDELAMVSRQLVTLSRINWRKHRLLQISLSLTVSAMSIGAVAVTLL